MSAPAFPAWSLPPGVAPPPGAILRLAGDETAVDRLPVTPEWVRALCDRLRATAPALRQRSAREVATLLGRVGARFTDPDDPLRTKALASIPGTSGLSPAMAATVLDGMAADWTGEGVGRILEADFPDPEVLDRFSTVRGAEVRAVGPDLCVQVVAGSVPGVGATALLRSLLIKAPTLVKPGRGDVVLPVLLAEALREADPELAASAAVVYWPGGDEEVEGAALEGAEVVTAYGGDDAVERIRRRTPITTRFLPYHHRLGVGIVGRDALEDEHRNRMASSVAGAVSVFDQRGCVSPHVVWVEEGGACTAADFARDLARALEAVERHLPGGRLDAAEASALHQLRGSAELLESAGHGVRVAHGGRASWTVVYDPDDALDVLCVGRMVRVRPVADAVEVPGRLAARDRHLQTVAVGGVGGRRRALAEALAQVGATRITSFDAAPFPPPGWHHDGRGALEGLVRWVDLEG